MIARLVVLAIVASTCTLTLGLGTGAADPLPAGIVPVDAGGLSACALTPSSGVRCWGYSGNGQLGDGQELTSSVYVVPQPVVGLSSGVTAVEGGENFHCALSSTGAVSCWGAGGNGQLGNGDTQQSAVPLAVSGLSSGVTAIAAGTRTACAVTGVGAVRCWGMNDFGQLGDGSLTGATEPVGVVGLDAGVTSVVTGGFHSCALTGAGGVVCWGRNVEGQLGDGSTTSSPVPVPVTGLSSGVVALSIAEYRTCALTSVGGVKCWGSNESGELGNGTTTSSSVPVDVVGLSSGVVSIANTSSATCALTSSGAVWCWGYDTPAGYDPDHSVASSVPIPKTGLPAGIVSLHGGLGTFCVLTDAGRISCWGAIPSYSDPTYLGSITPTPVAGGAAYYGATTPGAPTVSAVVGGDRSATVSWSPPASAGSSDISGYVVTPHVGAVAGTPQSFAPTATTQTVSGLTPGASYRFTVAAVNDAGPGTESDPSDALVATSVPGAPTDVTATAGDSSVDVSWTAPADDGGLPVTGYVVTPYVGAVAGTPQRFSSTATTETVTGLANGTTYRFRVAATNADGDGAPSAPSGEVTPARANVAPVAQAQAITVARHVATPIQLVATDGDDDPLTFTWNSPSALKGDLTCDQHGACTYQSFAGETGTDSFTFTADDGFGGTDTETVSITLANTAPVADDQAIDAERRLFTEILLGGSDENDDTLTYVAPATGPSKGSLDCSGPVCSYISDSGATGTDSFTFTADDGFGGTDTGTVTITLTNTAPIASSATIVAAVDTPTLVYPAGYDLNEDPVTVELVDGPSQGTLDCDVDLVCTYRSFPGATGTDEIAFTVTDDQGASTPGVLTIELTDAVVVADPQTVEAPRGVATLIALTGSAPGGAPLTFTAPVSGPSKGTLDCVADSCVYTSDPSATGTDEFTFTVDDGAGGMATATVTIDLVNSAPTAHHDHLGVTKGITKDVTLTGSDLNGDALTFTVTDVPTNGTLTCGGADGATCSYTATALTGTDSFSFVATDSFGATSDPQTVTITIALPKISVGDVQAVEPDRDQGWGAVYVPLTLSAPLPTDVTVSYHTVDGSAVGGVANADYRTWGTAAQPRTVKIPAGQTWVAVSVPIMPDALAETDEAFSVHLASVSAADRSDVGTLDATGTVIIKDNSRVGGDPLLTVADVSTPEGDLAAGQKGQLRIQFSRPLTRSLTVQLQWVSGTATEGAKGTGADWKRSSVVQVTLPAGASDRTIDLSIWGDTRAEGDEDLTLQVLVPDGAPIVQQQPSGRLTILDDD